MRELKIEKNMPIGFMDSGLGGLSVLRAAVKVMPQEDFARRKTREPYIGLLNLGFLPNPRG